MQVSPTNPTMVYLRLGFNLVCQDLALQLRRPRRRPKRRRRRRPKQPLWLHLVCQKWPRKLWMRWRLRSAMVSVILNCNIWYHWSIYYTYIYIYPPQPFQALQCKHFSAFFWGGVLKKELSNVTSVFLELPQNNQLRSTLGAYKTRFEEYMDEHLGWI